MFVNLHHASDPLSTHSFASVGLPRRYESLLYNAKSEVQKEEAIGIRKMGEGEGGRGTDCLFRPIGMAVRVVHNRLEMLTVGLGQVITNK